jgi:MarR family 2-MHQ and catechol resistance regulon transcriptional repressor
MEGFSREDRANLLPLLRRLGRIAETTFHAPQQTGAESRRKE